MSEVREPTQREIDASVELAQAEKLKALNEARKAGLEAQIAELELAREQDKRKIELATNAVHLVHTFDGPVTDASARSCIAELTRWKRIYPGEPIEIIFNSPGGSVVAGLALWDVIQEVRRAGHFVTTVAYGMAASMAGILLQAGDKRVMGDQSWLMIHEASFSAGGKVGEVEDTVEWVKMVQERIVKIFASRSHLSATQIRNKWRRKDWWISSDEAKKLGLIDEIR